MGGTVNTLLILISIYFIGSFRGGWDVASNFESNGWVKFNNIDFTWKEIYCCRCKSWANSYFFGQGQRVWNTLKGLRTREDNNVRLHSSVEKLMLVKMEMLTVMTRTCRIWFQTLICRARMKPTWQKRLTLPPRQVYFPCYAGHYIKLNELPNFCTNNNFNNFNFRNTKQERRMKNLSS